MLTRRKGDKMGNNTSQAPSKRVRIVLCSAVVAVAAIVPAAGFAADWTSSKSQPTADWTSAKRPAADWTSAKTKPNADWTSKVRRTADWTSARVAPKADWTSRYKASALR